MEKVCILNVPITYVVKKFSCFQETQNLSKKVKVKWSRYRPGVAQRVGKGIALLFHDRGTRKGWVVSSTPRPHLTPGKDSVPILQEAGWTPGPVWTGEKSRLHLDSISDRPVRNSVATPTELPGPHNPKFRYDVQKRPTEMSTRGISRGWQWPVRKVDNLTTILGRCHVIWEP